MEKEEFIKLLKEYKENKAKLNIKLKELKNARIKLKNFDDPYTSVTSSFGINQDIQSKNNISHRADLVNSNHKYILKTKGLNTKTSGTMTFTIDVARQSMNALLARKGVLYCSSEMTFFEEIIFKEKDLDRFFSLIESPAIKVSTILPFDCDDVIREFIDEIHSEILIR